MGAENLRTISFSGSGSSSGIGQNRNPRVAWPVTRMKTYSRQMDLKAGRSIVETVLTRNGTDQTQSQIVSGDSSWTSQFSFWMTPFGFLEGAMANNAAVTSVAMDGKRYSVVTFSVQNRYKVLGYINEQNLVERVQTWIDNDVLGDMSVEAWFSDYKDYGGVKFPATIVEKQAGFPVTILEVASVRPNAAVTVPLPSPAAPAAAPPAVVSSERIADGVYYLKGGTHHSVAVEFADHVVLIEAPLNEERSLALLNEIRRLAPGKPIRYVVNTHHHFDHSGGLRAFVDAGATIVTHQSNVEFFAAALAAPRTQNPDRLSRSQKTPVIEGVADKKVFSDSSRTLELHSLLDNPHHDGMLLAFLPKEKLLIEADVYTPAPGAAAAVNRETVNLVENVERLKLDYETIVPLHGAASAPRADLYAASRKPLREMKDILAVQPATPPGQGQRGQTAATIPAGQQILERACIGCHTLDRVVNKRLNESDWRTTVVRMKGRGADLPDNDADTLIQFLFRTYGSP
jgi:glyoxylase-like metal-dependent hydrolase (beta-lactamase superfamily II)